MNVSVVIPTITGREDGLRLCADSFAGCEIIPMLDHPTCGAAWVDGARRSSCQYIYFAADDVEAHDGFCEAMIEAVDRSLHPAALVLLPDGSKQSCGGVGSDVCRGECPDWQPVEWSPTPFIHRDWWPLIEPHADMLAALHYSSDCLVSAILTKCEIPSVMRREAVLTHYNSPVGRLGSAGSDGGIFHNYRVANAL